MKKLMIIAMLLAGTVAAQAQTPGAPSAMTRADAEARVRTMFETIDANHDGVLTQEELGAFRDHMREQRNIGDTARGQRPRGGRGMGLGIGPGMFEQADADHDGKLSQQELTAASLARFDAADANHNGTVTPEERQAMRASVAPARK